MLISEVYESKQGEGRLTGTPSVFVRTSGCNLRCTFCDTPSTSWEPSGDSVSLADLVQQIERFDARHAVITGGEPMLPKDIGELTKALKSTSPQPFHITIETAGTVFQDVECDLMSISPKLANSTPTEARAGAWQARHDATRHRPDVINRLIEKHDYQLKYVVADPDDIGAIQEHLSELKGWIPEKVLLMPEGVDQTTLNQREEWLAPLSQELGFGFCPRKHIEWYGNKRGT